VRKLVVDIALPVLNEERSLENSVRTLQGTLRSECGYDWYLTIVDNGSTDESWAIARHIVRTYPNTRALRLDRRGRGGALKAAWTSSTADIMAYMDIDLSTGLEAMGSLIDPIAAGTTDISVGSRLTYGSQVTRSLRRDVISHIYNVITRAMLRYPVRDAQCGFKAVNRQVANSIVPIVEDNSWFFDTELLVLAFREGLRINEIAVQWVEDEDSRVRIVKTAMDDLRGILRLWRGSDRAASRSREIVSVCPVESISATSEALPTEQSSGLKSTGE
jgi:glycosyltransferase involved in cell wall biosynthesis